MSLDFWPNTQQDLFCEFIKSCTLESLAIFGTPLPVKGFLDSQAQTLQFLLLDWIPPSAELTLIRKTCSCLRFLAIGSSRAESAFESKLLDQLSNFTRLKCLRLSRGPIRVNHLIKWVDDLEASTVFPIWERLSPERTGNTLKKLAVELECQWIDPYAIELCNGWTTSHPGRRRWTFDAGKLKGGTPNDCVLRDGDLVGFWCKQTASFPDSYDYCPVIYPEMHHGF
ncbi:hypothetical protein MMC25_002982 [Agyrium rufum]|nr:hypothetical protein [Agyrium rufum]